MFAYSWGIFCHPSSPLKYFPTPSPAPSKIPRLTNEFRPRHDGGELAPGWEEFLTASSQRETRAPGSSNLRPDSCV